MRDLEIRGAGDLLGAEQSGHVAALGFELYVEMLHEVVAELSGERRRRRAAGARRRAGRRLRPGRATSPPRRSRSTCTAGSRSSRTRTSCTSCGSRPRIATGRCPSRSSTCSRSSSAKLKLAAARRRLSSSSAAAAPRVGPVVLGSGELRALRERVDTAVYSSGNREVTLRGRGARRGARAGRCYDRGAQGGLSRCALLMKAPSPLTDAALGRAGARWLRWRRRQTRPSSAPTTSPSSATSTSRSRRSTRRSPRSGRASRQQGADVPEGRARRSYATMQTSIIDALVQEAEFATRGARSSGSPSPTAEVRRAARQRSRSSTSAAARRSTRRRSRQQGFTDAEVATSIQEQLLAAEALQRR